MTKAPRAGSVKTRLTPPLTQEEAAALNRCFLRDMTAAISRVGAGARGIACFTPAAAENDYQDIIPAEFKLIAQRGENLDERLTSAMQDLFSIGFSAVCLIGSDSPTVPTAVFAKAIEILSAPADRIVLGPSSDGGYYLIGLKQLHRRIFEGVNWSTDRVVEQTLQRANELHLDVCLLPTFYDVDDPATLRRLCDELLGSRDPERKVAAPATQGFLREIIAREGRARIWPAKPKV